MRISRWILSVLAFVAVAALVAAAARGRPPVPVQGDDGVAFTRVDVGGPTDDRASTGGAGLVDVDGDLDLDLFVTNGYDVSAEAASPQSDRLYLNEGGGRFVTVEDVPMTSEGGFGSGQSWGDYDNDGDADVFVAQQQGQDNLLWRNDGDGRFTRVTEGPPVSDGGASYAASWVDYDGDGWLDLYVANGGLSSVAASFLYRNRGDGTFERITEGPLVTDSAAHTGPAWGDYDDDGDPDLFIARNFSPGSLTSALYRNDGGGRFTPVTDIAPVTDTFPALGASWGDMDGDGDLDLAVSVRSGWAQALYRNDGDGRFTRVRDRNAVLGLNGSSAVWMDHDNDGDLDLLHMPWGSPAVLLTNDGGGRFAWRDHGDLGRSFVYGAGSAIGDYDGDGDLDVFQGNWPNWPGVGEEAHLYRNDAPAAHWLDLRLEGTRSNRSGIGARVTVRARIDGRDVTQVRELFPDTGFRARLPLRLHFGLGDADTVEEIVVRWPSGTVQRLEDVAADRVLTITEG